MEVSEPASLLNTLLSSSRWHFLLAAIKGLRNGAVYGVKIRAPHALVMTFLFGKGRLEQKLQAILQATMTHSKNLAKFAFSYKLLTGCLEKLHGSRWQFHSFVSAFVVGYFVFGVNNNVNMQINLYLLSRILVGLARLAVDKGYIPHPTRPVFPWFAAIVWGVVLWLFEYHQRTLQPSLQSSMTYLYHDSNHFTSFIDWLWVNKLPKAR